MIFLVLIKLLLPDWEICSLYRILFSLLVAFPTDVLFAHHAIVATNGRNAWQTSIKQHLYGRLPYWRLKADIFSVMAHLVKCGRVSLLDVLKGSPVCLHLVSLLRSHLWDRHTMLLPTTLRSIECWPWCPTSDMFLLFRGVVRSSSCVCVYYPVWTTQLSDISGFFLLTMSKKNCSCF